jgi:hypothetical protein
MDFICRFAQKNPQAQTSAQVFAFAMERERQLETNWIQKNCEKAQEIQTDTLVLSRIPGTNTHNPGYEAITLFDCDRTKPQTSSSETDGRERIERQGSPTTVSSHKAIAKQSQAQEETNTTTSKQ